MVCLACCGVWLAGIFAVLVAIKRFVFGGSKAPIIHKTDWKEGVVYLYQFKKVDFMPNLSPFCMKVELFLRAHNIKYEVVADNFKRSHKGLLPFIEYNGQQIADSEFILDFLAKEFKVKEELSLEQAGADRAFSRMFDEDVFRIQLVYKIKENEFFRLIFSDLPGFLVPLLAPLGRWFIGRRITAYTAHSEQELLQMYRRNLKAASDFLTNKKFFGGDHISNGDCAVFGQLASVYLIPCRTITHELIDNEYPVLKKYINNVLQSQFSEFVGKQK